MLNATSSSQGCKGRSLLPQHPPAARPAQARGRLNSRHRAGAAGILLPFHFSAPPAVCKHACPFQGQTRSVRCMCKSAVTFAINDAASRAAAIPPKDGFWLGTYYAHMAVRDYELDQFSVVNNGVYASYLQHARHRALASIGLSVESFQQAGVLMALSELVMRYKAPLRAQDTFVVTASVSKVTGARVVLEQRVVRLPAEGSAGNGSQPGVPEVVLDGESTVVFLDSSYRPIRVPTQAKAALQRLHSEYMASETASIAGSS